MTHEFKKELESRLEINIGQTRIKENTEDDWKSIKETFGPTIIKRAEPRDKAYYNDKLLDHACPYTIRSGSGYF